MGPLHALLFFFTDIGDTACLLAMVGAGALYFISSKAHRHAAFLVGTLMLSGFFIALLKLAFLGCHARLPFAHVHSPSGHASDSVAVLMAYGLLMGSRLPVAQRIFTFCFLLILFLCIAWSRVALGFHTPQEVIAGSISGLCAFFLARHLFLKHADDSAFQPYAFALWSLAAGLAAHGLHLRFEDIVHVLAFHIKKHIALCGLE